MKRIALWFIALQLLDPVLTDYALERGLRGRKRNSNY
jgi:hypothetical protein